MKKTNKKQKSEKKKKKSKQKKVESPELSQLKALTDQVKGMASELEKLQEVNKSLKADIKNLKKKDKKKKGKKPEVVTTVMEPQVLPPTKTKTKRTRKATAPKVAAKSKSTSDNTVGKAKPGPKTKGKPGPKPKANRGRKPSVATGTTKTTRKPATAGRPSGSEDLKFIQGLGAKIETLLNQQGVKTFADLAKASQASVKGVLEKAGPRFKNQDPKPLIDQAKLVKAEKWSDLESLQADLMKGKKKPGPKTGGKK